MSNELPVCLGLHQADPLAIDAQALPALDAVLTHKHDRSEGICPGQAHAYEHARGRSDGASGSWHSHRLVSLGRGSCTAPR